MTTLPTESVKLIRTLSSISTSVDLISLSTVAFDALVVLQWMLYLSWDHLSNTPSSSKNVFYDKFFATFDVFQEIAIILTLVFAEDLFEVCLEGPLHHQEWNPSKPYPQTTKTDRQFMVSL
ncbi:hypothetical protein ONS96_014562 [Cadophora gregata f. sp. sojae]|nr:hypothetical protein ONS96_014562 [Cadophora gregata f. sp. sojae]